MVEKKKIISKTFFMITLVSLSYWFGASIYSPVLPLLMRSYGYSMIEIGFLALARSIGFGIFEPITGLYYDKIGLKKLIIIGTVLGTLSIFLFSLATQLWEFMAISFLFAAGGACISSPTRASIAHSTSKSQRGKGYGAFTAILASGRIVGPPLGGFLAQTINYTMPFYASTVVLTAGMIISFILFKKQGLQNENNLSETSKTQENPRLSIKNILTFSVITVLLLRVLSIFIMNFNQNILPVYVQENPKILATETEIGLMLGIYGLVSAILGFFLGALIDRFGRKKLIILSTLLCAFTFISYLAINNILPIFITQVTLSIGLSTTYLVLTVLLMDNVPSTHYGIAMGFFGLSEDIGGIISSVPLGYIYDAWGIKLVFYFLSLLMFLSTIISILFVKEKK